MSGVYKRKDRTVEDSSPPPILSDEAGRRRRKEHGLTKHSEFPGCQLLQQVLVLCRVHEGDEGAAILEQSNLLRCRLTHLQDNVCRIIMCE